jgi:hypothetical protein
MAVTASTREVNKSRVRYYGGGAEDDNEVILDVDVEGLDSFIVGSVAGVVDVYVSIDGAVFFATPVAMENLGSLTPATRLAATVAGGQFLFKGAYKRIRVLQVGTTDVTGLQLVGWREGA